MECVSNRRKVDEYRKETVYRINKLLLLLREGHEDIVELLLRKKASKLVRTRNGRTPAHTAALHGHLNVLKLLLIDQSNSVLNSRDNCGSTPFMEAVIADHLDIVKYLLENHNVRARNNNPNSKVLPDINVTLGLKISHF